MSNSERTSLDRMLAKVLAGEGYPLSFEAIEEKREVLNAFLDSLELSPDQQEQIAAYFVENPSEDCADAVFFDYLSGIWSGKFEASTHFAFELGIAIIEACGEAFHQRISAQLNQFFEDFGDDEDLN